MCSFNPQWDHSVLIYLQVVSYIQSVLIYSRILLLWIRQKKKVLYEHWFYPRHNDLHRRASNQLSAAWKKCAASFLCNRPLHSRSGQHNTTTTLRYGRHSSYRLSQDCGIYTTCLPWQNSTEWGWSPWRSLVPLEALARSLWLPRCTDQAWRMLYQCSA